MTQTQVPVDGGKYTFVIDGGRVDILRHGEKWVTDLQCQGINAVMSLIFEYETALARQHAEPVALRSALARLTEWAQTMRAYGGAFGKGGAA